MLVSSIFNIGIKRFKVGAKSSIEFIRHDAKRSGEEIQAIREKEGISQAVFARRLNVGTKLVSDWERGAKRPSGPSLKLLVLVRTKGLDTIA